MLAYSGRLLQQVRRNLPYAPHLKLTQNLNMNLNTTLTLNMIMNLNMNLIPNLNINLTPSESDTESESDTNCSELTRDEVSLQSMYLMCNQLNLHFVTM